MKRWKLLPLAVILLLFGSIVPVLAPPSPLPEETIAPTSQPGATGEVDRTGFVKAFYVSRSAIGNAQTRQYVRQLLDETELNAVVLDFKGDQGLLTFPTQVDLARAIGAGREVMVNDPRSFLGWFRQRGVYIIARIVVFKDDLLATARPDWAISHAETGLVWRDHEGMSWIDPYRQEAWAYNIALAVEAARLGFDEVQFDYVRFPTDGDVEGARYSLPSTRQNRVTAISGLLSATQQALQSYRVRLAADVFGYAAWMADDLGIGQHVEALAPHLDVLAPMLYPSTFDAGLPGESSDYKNAIAYPYEIVRRSTERAVDRAKAVNPEIEIRPWIQDFADYAFDGRTYTPAEIRDQMNGAREGGSKGWMLWNPAVQYSRMALVSSTPSHRPNIHGKVPILAYEQFAIPGEQTGTEEDDAHTRQTFHEDLARLLADGFYPVNLRDLVQNDLDMVPAGKRPVVLTFDGSTPEQFRLLPDSTPDPESAVGALLAFHAAHPADWPLKATFFVQPGDDAMADLLFGTEALAGTKLQMLADWGMEIGVMPAIAPQVARTESEAVRQAVASAISQIRTIVPTYDVVSFYLGDAIRTPLQETLAGAADGSLPSAFATVAQPQGGLAPSPQAADFSPLNLPRVFMKPADRETWDQRFGAPSNLYVSGGEQ